MKTRTSQRWSTPFRRKPATQRPASASGTVGHTKPPSASNRPTGHRARGDNKTLGNWGELTERLLDASGGKRPRLPSTSQRHQRGGQRQQPDPHQSARQPLRIIDAKTSLKDYLAHVNATDEPARTGCAQGPRRRLRYPHQQSCQTALPNLSRPPPDCVDVCASERAGAALMPGLARNRRHKSS